VGLVRAARRFDPTRGTRVTTYAAWWIRQAIAQGVADRAGVVRVPVERVALLHRVGRRARALTQELGREPTHLELAAEMSIPPMEAVRLTSATSGVLSLDAAATVIDEVSALDPGEHSARADLSAPLMHRELAADLEQALKRLPPREARTLRLCFGLDGDEPMTLLEIGRVLGVTRERARQIKVLALEHLRHNQTGRRLAMHRA
jgi:RNA polymerase primary sigma factor